MMVQHPIKRFFGRTIYVSDLFYDFGDQLNGDKNIVAHTSTSSKGLQAFNFVGPYCYSCRIK